MGVLSKTEKRPRQPLPDELPPPAYSELDESQKLPEAPATNTWVAPQQAPPNQQAQYINQPPPNPNYNAGVNPNVYMVPPQLVNITQAPAQYLDPAYQQYLARDQERIKMGDFPKPRSEFKHGAPLEPSVKKKNGSSGGSFPGRGGATYYNAANK